MPSDKTGGKARSRRATPAGAAASTKRGERELALAIRAFWLDVKHGRNAGDHPVWGQQVRPTLSGDGVTLRGQLASAQDRATVAAEAARAFGGKVTNELAVAPAAERGSRGRLRQGVVGVFDERVGATTARDMADDHQRVPLKDMAVLRPSMTRAKRREALLKMGINEELVEELQEHAGAGRTLLALSVDEVDTFAARTLLSERGDARVVVAGPAVTASGRPGRTHKQKLGLGAILRAAGPGIITGGADNDPGGITTYSVVGATLGFSQAWLLIISTPLLIAVQEMCARIGNVTKTDLATVFRAHFGRPVTYGAVGLLMLANVITIGADLVGMSAALSLLTHVKAVTFVVPMAALMAFVTIFLDYRTVTRYLLFLVAVFAAYIVAAFMAHPNWGEVARATFLPHLQLNSSYWVAAVGLLGTTITPYLFFWQTSGEVEGERGVQALPRTRLDITIGMVWSNVTAYFMIAATALTLYPHHISINSAADAAQALVPFAGPYARLLFAVGIIGAGFLAVPVLATSTAYAVGGTLGWPRGLGRHVRNAPQFYLVLGAALLLGVQLALSGFDPVQALFYSQVLNGVIGAPLLFLIWKVARSSAMMGSFVSPRWVDILGLGAVVVMLTADLALAASLLHII